MSLKEVISVFGSRPNNLMKNEIKHDLDVLLKKDVKQHKWGYGSDVVSGNYLFRYVSGNGYEFYLSIWKLDESGNLVSMIAQCTADSVTLIMDGKRISLYNQYYPIRTTIEFYKHY